MGHCLPSMLLEATFLLITVNYYLLTSRFHLGCSWPNWGATLGRDLLSLTWRLSLSLLHILLLTWRLCSSYTFLIVFSLGTLNTTNVSSLHSLAAGIFIYQLELTEEAGSQKLSADSRSWGPALSIHHNKQQNATPQHILWASTYNGCEGNTCNPKTVVASP